MEQATLECHHRKCIVHCRQWKQPAVHHKNILVINRLSAKSFPFQTSSDFIISSFLLHTGPYQNLPFGNYYPPPGPTTAHLSSSSSSSSTSASSERRPSAAAISTFEQFDNVNKAAVAAHDRYTQHLSNISISAISTPDDERSARSGDANAAPNTAANAGGGSEFSGLVSYFSSQQDDLDT